MHNLDDLYKSLVYEWQDPALVVRSDNNKEVPNMLSDELPKNGLDGMAKSQ